MSESTKVDSNSNGSGVGDRDKVMDDLNISDQSINAEDTSALKKSNKKVSTQQDKDSTTGSTSTTTTTTTTTTTPAANPNKRKSKAEIVVEIEDLLQEKKSIEGKLSSLEKQIYALEGRYLEDTHHIGNVIRGFDSYISGSGALKKLRWKESDRLFSTSSSTYLNSINESAPEVQVISKKKDKGKSSSVSSKKNG